MCRYQVLRKLLVLLLSIFLLLTVGSTFVSAVCHAVTPNGAGSRDGSTWDNAFAGLPATLLRGDTYYIATGSYPGYRFNAPESGTTVITIKKATATDHCTETGWQASFGNGQAVWTPSGGRIWQFTDTGYWSIDGQSRTNLKSGHGFKLDNSGSNAIATPLQIQGCGPGTSCSPSIQNVTIRYTEIAGGGVNSGSTPDSYTVNSASRDSTGTIATLRVTGVSPTPANNRFLGQTSTVVGSQITVSGVADATFNTTNARVTAADSATVSYSNSGTANATSSGGTVVGGLGTLAEFDIFYAGRINNITLEYLYIHDTSDTPIQSNGQASNVTIQYCDLARNTSSGGHHSEGIADQSSNRPTDSVDPNGKTTIRYNVFEDIEGTGFIVSVGTGPTNNLEIYGNVFMWHQGNPYRRSGIGNGIIATTSNSVANNWVAYNNTFVNVPNGSIFSTFNRAGGTGFTAYNNLCYSPSSVSCSFPEKVAGEITHDYTACFTTGSCPSEAHIQTATSIPLVDWLNENYRLGGPTSAGITLSAPYNLDPDGAFRGAGGFWNRGAYEFLNVSRPAPATNLRISP